MAKSTKVSGWRSRSTGFLGSIAAVALIVVLLGGMALGYEIEKGRVKTTKTSQSAKNKNAKNKNAKNKKGVTAKYTSFRVTGTVDAISPTSITVKSAKGATRKVTIGKNTVFVTLANGTMSDITADVRVVYAGSGSITKAKAVIVLPKSAKVGTMVSAATPTTMSLKPGKKAVTITTTGATVNTVAASTVGAVTKGAKIILGGVKAKGGASVATEIIVLPAGSPYA